MDTLAARTLLQDLEIAREGLARDLARTSTVRGVTTWPLMGKLVVWLPVGAPPTFTPTYVECLNAQGHVRRRIPVETRRSDAPLPPANEPFVLDAQFGGTPSATWLADGGVDAWLRRVDTVRNSENQASIDAAFVAHQGGHDPYPMGGALPVHARYEVWVREGTNAFPLEENLQVDDRPRTYRLLRRPPDSPPIDRVHPERKPRYVWTADDVPMLLSTAGHPWWIVADDVFGRGVQRGLSTAGQAWLEREEGVRRRVYNDKTGQPIASFSDPGLKLNGGAGYPTIGVGLALLTPELRDRYRAFLTRDMTDAELRASLTEALTPRIAALNRMLTVPVTQDQFDALFSFYYNRGASDGLKAAVTRLNAGDAEGAAQAIADAQHRESNPNLRARRLREATLFRSGHPPLVGRPFPTPSSTRGDAGEGGGAGLLIGLAVLLGALFLL